VNFIVLIVGLAMLIGGSEFIIRGSVSLGKKLKISLFAIGIVVVSAGTSLPELANSILAVISNHPDIAVGAVVGSNIANIILIMGLTTLLHSISDINQNQINQAIINIFITFVFIIMSLLLIQFNFIFGILALISLIVIMFYQVRLGSLNFSEVKDQGEYSLFISGLLITVGVFFLIYGSKYFVSASIEIARDYDIPESVIGVSLVAFGTSLPELAVGILSAIRKKVDFALGNILGSNIYNILGVLGVSSFFGNFSIPSLIASLDLYVMALAIILITFFMVILKRLGRTYGIVSLIIYINYIGYIYLR